jgi:farnesyl-diphosphate farnesyltransferase
MTNKKNEINSPAVSDRSAKRESDYFQSLHNVQRKFKNFTEAELQSYLLDNVSRTFALTIPELPPALAHVVSNAYLLCRIVDTVEDEPQLSAAQKKDFCNRFIAVVEGTKKAEEFSRDLYPLLSNRTLPGEKELIALTRRVIDITHQCNEQQQQAMKRCIRIMADGMAFFQQNASTRGLRDLKEMDKYCYYVAGVVGEMCTELFCIHSPFINENRDELMRLAVSFGQGLQMTNIIKDVWEDYERGACWMPGDYFNDDLSNLQRKESTQNFQGGIESLIGVTHTHLQNAMEYILLIPQNEKGIRRFCYWAVGMAVLTIKKVHKNLDYTNGEQVKISRNSVKTTILLTNITVGSNFWLKKLFDFTRRGLPKQVN